MKTMIAQFNRFEVELPEQCVKDCSHSGPCDEDVEFWFLKLDTDKFPCSDAIQAELQEYGAWDEDELQDKDQNLRRLIWIAAGNIRDAERDVITRFD